MENYRLYMNGISELYSNLDLLIRGAVLKGKRVFLFSANSESGKMRYYLREKGIVVEGIVDNDPSKRGMTQYGLRIFSPKEVFGAFDDDIRVLIATQYVDSMIAQMESFGYRLSKHIFVVLDLARACSDFRFVDRSDCSPIDLSEKKKSMLGTLELIDSYCTSSGIQYYLGFGSMLGAVRHKGMIPWDDDVDILMPLPDYVEFSNATNNRGWNQRYSVYTSFSNCDYFFTELGLVADNNYICDFACNPQYTAGYPVDVYPIIGLPEGREEQKNYIELLKEKESMLWTYRNSVDDMKEKRAEINELMGKYDYYDSEYCMIMIGHVAAKGPMRKKWFSETCKMSFENKKLNVPIGYDEWLTWMYGDYMTPPPENERDEKYHGYNAYVRGRRNQN